MMKTKYCAKCGLYASKNDPYCPNCGTELGEISDSREKKSDDQGVYVERSNVVVIDAAGCLTTFIAFIFPFIGLILFFVWMNERPNSARTVLIAAILGALVFGVGGASCVAG